MNHTKPRIGIIGGAGPMAGALLFEKIIEVSQRHGCKVDADFPFCLLMNYPFGPMLTSECNKNALQKDLEQCFAFLANNNVTIAAIACNTLHAFLPTLPEGMQLVHIIKETESYLKKKAWHNPLILCSSTSARTKLHAQFFTCRYPNPSLQETVDIMIDKITEGCCLEEASRLLSEKTKNEGPIILGCTELSLLHARAPLQIEELCIPDCIVAEKIGKIYFGKDL